MAREYHRHVRKTGLACALAILCVGIVAVSTRAQTTSTVWNGIYTAEQAKRGEQVFKEYCSPCHAEDLTGADGPALKGELFAITWEGKTVGRLFQRLRRMPPRRTSLELEEYRDALAFILQENGYPAGERELSTDPSALEQVALAPKP
jgi:cytochrome c5